jgi:hypothetical protein
MKPASASISTSAQAQRRDPVSPFTFPRKGATKGNRTVTWNLLFSVQSLWKTLAT